MPYRQNEGHNEALTISSHVLLFMVLIEVAIRIWVGYDKKGRTKVNITYPVANKTLVGPKNGISNSELQTIENLAYELSGLLDKDIGRFAHGIYDYLQGLSDHESFVDTLWVNWVQAKEAAAQVASAYKEYVHLT